MLIVLGLTIAFLAGFLIGCKVYVIRYIPLETIKTEDLYPKKGPDDGPNAS